MLRAKVNDLCGICHDTGPKHTIPLGDQYKDPRTGGPLTCLSCHDPHASAFDYQLLADQRRDLCIECHSAGH